MVDALYTLYIGLFVWVISSSISCRLQSVVGSLGKMNHLPVRLRMGHGMLKEKRLRYASISRYYESDNSKGMFRQIERFLISCAGDCAVEEWVFPKDARVSLKSLIVESSRRGRDGIELLFARTIYYSYTASKLSI
jgi:hypothetical protein